MASQNLRDHMLSAYFDEGSLFCQIKLGSNFLRHKLTKACQLCWQVPISQEDGKAYYKL